MLPFQGGWEQEPELSLFFVSMGASRSFAAMAQDRVAELGACEGCRLESMAAPGASSAAPSPGQSCCRVGWSLASLLGLLRVSPGVSRQQVNP